jgi:DNA-binding winged helix-turn-helix (wHTH) protein
MRYVFGDYSLDTQRYELRRAGELIPLGPQVFNVLTYLVTQRDRVVSRDELFARLWPRQFVTDDALSRCIRAARRALEDHPEAPQYIATTRGRGYRFIAPVIEHGGGPPDPLAVPETIEAVLAARIDRLAPEEKRLLQTAAVMGMAVPVPLLQAMADLTAGELSTHLGHLQTAEFLYETSRLPVSAYAFKHALTHEVAYGSLLQEQRRVLHGRTAQAIETLFAERLPEHYYALAHHYSRSGHTTKAVDYLQRAGHQAVERSAYAEAVSHPTTAIELLTTLPESRERSQLELGV